MIYRVCGGLKVRTPKGIMELQGGELITLSQEKADRLVKEGKVIPVESQIEPTPEGQENITSTLDIESCNIALEVYSQILGESVWFCSNETMVERVKCDTPGAVCYTMDEMREIVRLEPVPEDLKTIHKVKRAFPGSKIKENLEERRLDIEDLAVFR